MNFCVKCDNLYYMKVTDDGKLIYYCRNCGNEETNVITTNLCISSYEENKQKTNKINEYTKYDPSLPHVHNVKCPKEDCPSNKKDSTSDVIYIRVDDVQMRYIYLCVFCESSWKP
jgi:DNA-directed RNA polymerase subunit M/transcription elongation factor TFIIS